MSNTVILVENLSKRYRLRHLASGGVYRTFREAVTERLTGWNRRRAPSQTTEDFWALKDISFTVERGEVVGIVGRNGAGKSTLLKILSRITHPTNGSIQINGRMASLLEVGTGFHPELTGRENVFLNGAILGMTRLEIKKNFDSIVQFAEVESFLDTPVKRYSSGMYVRLAFSVAAHLEPEILVIDEVLAVGDTAFQKKCLGKIGDVARSGRTVLFVSHNLGVVSALCTKGIFLSKGEIKYAGEIKSALSYYTRSGIGSNIKMYSGGEALNWVSVEQVSSHLLISARFRNFGKQLRIPGLGFVISDMNGQPLFGHNPMLDSVEAPVMEAGHDGIVTVTVKSPVLLDGEYSISIWFGDDTTDLLHDPHCLRFEVAGMIAGKQLPAHKVGSIYPICSYQFISSSDERFNLLDRTTFDTATVSKHTV